MDRIDKRILEILQTNCKIDNQALAEKIALSPSSCLRRVKRLEEEGYISKYVALLNPEKIGLSLTIMALVGLNSHDPKVMSNFEKIIRSLPEVIQCYLITGQSADYMLKIVVSTLNDYQAFVLNKLTRIEGVINLHSSFVLNKVTEKTALPLTQKTTL